MQISLPNSAFLGNIDAFLRSFDPSDPGRLRITFNPNWVSVHPIAISMTASLGLHMKGQKKEIICDTALAKSKNYLERMGLFALLGARQKIKLQEHEPAGRFIPLTVIKGQDELEKFIEDLVPLLHTTPSQAEAIKYTVSELVRNVIEHAKSPVGAVVCAQFFKKTSRVSIGVADVGVGIRETIGASYAVKSDGEAIKLALVPGVTGTTARPGGTEANAGAGLFFIKSIAQANRNFFVLYSGDSMYKLLKTPAQTRINLHADPEDDRHSFLEGLPYWQGTAVGVDISVADSQNFVELLNLIRKVYRLDVREKISQKYKKARFI